MFNKLRKILIKDGIKTPEYQQIFNNVIGYDDIKTFVIQNDYIKIYKFCSIDWTSCIFKNYIHIGVIRSFQE